MSLTSPGKALRAVFESEKTELLPLGSVPIHAQMAQHAGFGAFQLSGGASAWWQGISDVGWLTMTEVVDLARRTVRAADIPIYCDGDTGYGAPLNVQRTVLEFIDAGVAGIHIEDQREPKKSGGVAGVELVSDAEAIGRLNAACDARDKLDQDFVIVARTDGYGAAGGGLDEAIRRAQLYKAETGADVIFYEGLHTWEQAEIALKETPGPAYVVGVPMIGTRTVAEMTAMGQAVQSLPVFLPGVREVYHFMVDAIESGEATGFPEYLQKVNDDAGTKYDIGWGAMFGRPSSEEVRRIEQKYLPKDAQRDYESSAHAGETY